MNKTTLLGFALLACCFAPPTDGGGGAPPLLINPTPDAAAEAEASRAAAAAVEAAAAEAAAAAAAAQQSQSGKPSAATPRTQARLDPTKKPAKAGARARKPKAVSKADADSESIVGIVLQTSRVNGADGRAIPRRTVALAKSARADALIGRGWAREATEAETAKATMVLD